MTNDSIDNVRLDINSEKVQACIYVRKGDTKMRTLHITLVNRGKVVSLENAAYVEILISKADGYVTDQGAVVVGDEVQYTLRTQDVAATGENLCMVSVTFTDGSVITSPKFSIMVFEKTVSDKTIQSTNEYTALAQQVINAQGFATSAQTSATTAETALTNVQTEVSAFDTKYETYNTHFDEVKEQIDADATAVNTAKEEAVASADTATTKASEASTSASNASTSEANASAYAETATSKASEASESATSASDSATSASASAESASASATLASSYETITGEYAKKSESYAVGDTDLRQEESTDNAKYYYEQAKIIAQSFSGAMLFQRTCTFDEIPSLTSTEVGYQYNISDEFTTDSRFIEGSGILKGAGTDIVCIKDDDGNHKWNCLSGVTVHGVKGSAEQTYRQGNVEITADNLGLASVATSGSYEDLSDKPTIPTDNSQLVNGAGYITKDGSCASSEDSNELGGQLPSYYTSASNIVMSDGSTSVESAISNIDESLAIHRSTLTAGETSVTFSDLTIGTNSVFEFYTSSYGTSPTAVEVGTDSVTATFDAQESDIEVGLAIR